MKSNPYKFNPAKQDFIAKAISSTEWWISSVEDGYNCVMLVLEYHAMSVA